MKEAAAKRPAESEIPIPPMRSKDSETSRTPKGEGTGRLSTKNVRNLVYDKASQKLTITKVSDRDGDICAFTKMTYSDKAHIWPHCINKEPERFRDAHEAIAAFLRAINPTLFTRITRLLNRLDEGGNMVLRCSDKHWNVIKMQTQMHRYWGKARFGLEPLMKTTKLDDKFSTIRVRWHWLPRQLSDALSRHNAIRPGGDTSKPCRLRVDLYKEDLVSVIEEALQDFPGNRDVILPEDQFGHLKHGRYIVTGKCFELKVETEDAPKMTALLEAQWIAIRMAAISGAAEQYDDLRDRMPDWTADAAMPVGIQTSSGHENDKTGDELSTPQDKPVVIDALRQPEAQNTGEHKAKDVDQKTDDTNKDGDKKGDDVPRHSEGVKKKGS
jgi:hypothetical protein